MQYYGINRVLPYKDFRRFGYFYSFSKLVLFYGASQRSRVLAGWALFIKLWVALMQKTISEDYLEYAATWGINPMCLH